VTTVVPGTAERTVPNRAVIDVTRPQNTPGSTRGLPTSGTPGAQPAQPLPATRPVGVQGGGQAQKVLDSDGVRLIDGARLAEIDRALLDRLLVAADAEMQRALERAGARVRSALQARDRTLAGEVKGLAAENVCQLVGSLRVEELGISEDTLLGRAFERLSGKFTRWATQAVKDAAKAVGELLGLPLVTINSLVRTLTARIPTAWKGLESRLRVRAIDVLYGKTGDQPGEAPDTLVPPGDIRAALAEIGGLPPGGVDEQGRTVRPGEVLGGVALGRDITTMVDEKADRLGFIWRYGITPRERQFEPHRRLNGHRFPSWDDAALIPDREFAWVGPHFAPGDHRGCLCDYVPVWAFLETLGTYVTEVERETIGMGTERLLAEQDDAAGRIGTQAQRTRDERDRILAVQREWMERASGI
jgi:hypothetical protein